MVYPQSFYLFYHTATADTKFRLVSESVILRDVMVNIQDNDCLFGDTNNQLFNLNLGDVFTFDNPVDISDIFFKNATAGNNTKIVLTGVKI